MARYFNGFLLPENFQHFADQIRKMEIRSDDVWLCGIPRSGTTWVQEAVWCIANYDDFETSKKARLAKRFPYLEFTTFYDEKNITRDARKFEEFPEHHRDSVTFVEKLPSPRYVKTHLPFTFIPEKLQQSREAKIIYVARNPRDTCISFFHYTKLLNTGYKVDLETFCKLFLEGTVYFLPYWEHVLPFWRIRDNPNVLFITYEEIKKDLKGGILKIANFLGKNLGEEEVSNLIEHLSYEKMKKNPMVNREHEMEEIRKYKMMKETPKGSFMRCGQSGQWKDRMSHSTVQQFQKWEEEHVRDTGYPLILD